MLVKFVCTFPSLASRNMLIGSQSYVISLSDIACFTIALVTCKEVYDVFWIAWHIISNGPYFSIWQFKLRFKLYVISTQIASLIKDAICVLITYSLKRSLNCQMEKYGPLEIICHAIQKTSYTSLHVTNAMVKQAISERLITYDWDPINIFLLARLGKVQTNLTNTFLIVQINHPPNRILSCFY